MFCAALALLVAVLMPDCNSFLALLSSVLVASKVIPSLVCFNSLDNELIWLIVSSGAGL